MLFNLLFTSLSYQVYDFSATTPPFNFTIFLKPYEIVEIKLYCTAILFQYWENIDFKNAQFYIIEKLHTIGAFTRDTSYVQYGQYDSSSRIAGTFFPENYSMKIYNNGIQSVRFPMLLIGHFVNYNDKEGFQYLIEEYLIKYHCLVDFKLYPVLNEVISFASAHIVFYSDKGGKKFIAIIVTLILIALNIVIFILNCRDKGNSNEELEQTNNQHVYLGNLI